MNTVLILLGKEYSIHFKTLHVADDGFGGTRPIFFLLAAPFCTNPRWLNNILSDLLGSNIANNTEQVRPFDTDDLGTTQPTHQQTELFIDDEDVENKIGTDSTTSVGANPIVNSGEYKR